MPNPLIILGASTRAAAQSAVRAGYDPWCIDLFADRDLRAIAPVQRCPRDGYPHAMLDMLRDYPGPSDTPVLLTGAMENHPDVLRVIEQRHLLFTGPIEAIVISRDLAHLKTICEIASDKRLNVYYETPFQETSEPKGHSNGPHMCYTWSKPPWFTRPMRWFSGWRLLVKPVASSNGHSIYDWKPGMPIPQGHYVQEYVPGIPVSTVVYAKEGRVQIVGATEQLVGDSHFGAEGLTFVGNVGPTQLRSPMYDQFLTFAQTLVKEFGLSGVFGVDGVICSLVRDALDVDTLLYAVILEVNPRYPASADLIERATAGLSALEPESCNPAPTSGMLGKAIVYAKQPCRAPDLYDLFDADRVADVPEVGESFDTGDPVCTVYAHGETRDDCLAGLRAMADRLYTRLHA